MRYVDSSFLISFFLPDDSNHEKASAIFTKNSDELSVFFEVLVETLTVLNRQRGIDFTNDVYNAMRENARFIFKPPLSQVQQEAEFSFFLSQTPEQRLSFVDSLQVAYALANEVEILTFGDKLLKALKAVKS